jgi:hypothetical protein
MTYQEHGNMDPENRHGQIGAARAVAVDRTSRKLQAIDGWVVTQNMDIEAVKM